MKRFRVLAASVVLIGYGETPVRPDIESPEPAFFMGGATTLRVKGVNHGTPSHPMAPRPSRPRLWSMTDELPNVVNVAKRQGIRVITTSGAVDRSAQSEKNMLRVWQGRVYAVTSSLLPTNKAGNYVYSTGSARVSVEAGTTEMNLNQER